MTERFKRRRDPPLRDDPSPTAPRAKRVPDRSAPYYADLGPEPADHTVEAAAVFLATIRDVLTADLNRPAAFRYTRLHRANLQRIERRWRKRAAGSDLRWTDYGSRPGRLRRDEEDRIREESATTGAEWTGFTKEGL